MREPEHKTHLREHSLLLGLCMLLLFSSPLLSWWTSPANPWYLPYLLWLGIILLIAWLHIGSGG